MRQNRKTARRVANVLQYATYAAVAWGFIYPHPYGLAMLVVGSIPLVAVAIAVGGGEKYSLEGRRNDPRPDVATALVLPGLVLMFRAVCDQDLVDWQRMLWWAGTVTLAWTALLYWASPDLRKPALLLIVLVMGAYGYGAPALINRQLDTNAPEVFTTRVLGKHVVNGRSRSYYLDVAPWGPRTEHDDVSVTSAFYARSDEGGTVCVYLYPGALHARWFETGDCPRG